jgi:hypothetical protein
MDIHIYGYIYMDIYIYGYIYMDIYIYNPPYNIKLNPGGADL